MPLFFGFPGRNGRWFCVCVVVAYMRKHFRPPLDMNQDYKGPNLVITYRQRAIRDSNPWPLAWQARILTTELMAQGGWWRRIRQNSAKRHQRYVSYPQDIVALRADKTIGQFLTIQSTWAKLTVIKYLWRSSSWRKKHRQRKGWDSNPRIELTTWRFSRPFPLARLGYHSDFIFR